MPDIVEIAAGSLEGGADGLTLVNTLLGLALDTRTGRPVLGAGGGGLSGAPVHPVAVRAVWECRSAFPSVPIVGVGGRLWPGRRRAAHGGRRRRPGGHGHLPGSARAVEGAPAVGAVGATNATLPLRTSGPRAGRCAGTEQTEQLERANGRAKGCAGPGVTLEKEGIVAEGFADRVSAAVLRAGPLCAGIDPSAELLGRAGTARRLRGYAVLLNVLDVFAGVVGVVKAQVAVLQRHASAGMAELEDLLRMRARPDWS